jgi:hypothetical protein
VGERELAEHETAEYWRWKAEHPDARGKDFSDLAAIGAARYQKGVTYEKVAGLVHIALDHGRTWDQIADRLGMTPEQARDAYAGSQGKPASLRESVAFALVCVASNILRTLHRALSAAGGLARDHSRH